MTKNERLKQARVRKGITQEELAKLMGVSTAYIGQLETKRTFGIKQAKKLAGFLGVDSNWLYQGRDTNNIKFEVAEESRVAPYGDTRWIDPNLSVMENLQKIIDFKREGLITEDEFIRIKNKIIPKD